MHCPFCGYEESKVVDSRSTPDGERVRRRRECLKCAGRFTTFESLETIPLEVVKKNGVKEPFDRDKLTGRLIRACGKRPVPFETIEKAVSDIESEVSRSFIKEVSSKQIAEMVLQKLKKIDIVAYIRFISVYHEFSSVEEFMDELKNVESSN